MKPTILHLILAKFVFCTPVAAEDPQDFRDLSGRYQLYFALHHDDEMPKSLITFRITEAVTYHSGDTTDDLIYIFKATVISSDSKELKVKEDFKAYFQKRMLGRELIGPEKMNMGDEFSISVFEVHGDAIKCALLKTKNSD